MNDLEEILAAKTSDRHLNDLIIRYRPWILRCASEATHRYVTDSDDEWSVALMAFHEAVTNYEEEKGPFRVFATVVIRRRILDFLRSERKRNAEISVTPEAFGGDLPEEEVGGVNTRVQRQVAEESSARADTGDLSARTREEIASVQHTLGRYGFSFFDLTECSPKAEKTRKSCAIAIRCLLDNRDLMEQMQKTRMLPMKELINASGTPRKILDRHRRYIIAAAEILSGEYPIISAYLDFVRKV